MGILWWLKQIKKPLTSNSRTLTWEPDPLTTTEQSIKSRRIRSIISLSLSLHCFLFAGLIYRPWEWKNASHHSSHYERSNFKRGEIQMLNWSDWWIKLALSLQSKLSVAAGNLSLVLAPTLSSYALGWLILHSCQASGSLKELSCERLLSSFPVPPWSPLTDLWGPVLAEPELLST